MYTGSTIFSQLMQYVPWHHFHQCVVLRCTPDVVMSRFRLQV